jgi:glyoxylase-like metal-dependent hydrolase (beta-lactamase superfamily II)
VTAHSSRVFALLALIAGPALLAAPALRAQQHPASTHGGLEIIQIRPTVHVVFGAGANVTVHSGEDGLVLVDSGATDMADALLAVLKTISPKPVRLIVNTSADADHVGGNETVAGSGIGLSPDPFSPGGNQATILAHENVMLRMSGVNGTGKPFPTRMWPNDTFTTRFRPMYVNEDGVQVIRQLGAHSDGDSMVLFRRADVIATGDILDLRQFPVIDPALGGGIGGQLEALNRLLIEFVVPNIPQVLKPGRTLVVPGHGYISDYGEVVEYRDMLTIIRDTIQDMKNKGMTLQQVKTANPTKGYRARFGKDTGPWTTDMFVEAVYNGLKRAES